MPSEPVATYSHKTSLSRAVRHHVAIVLVCLVAGAAAGWLFSASGPTTYTSSARVLVNPSVGNPFVPTPLSVRQDELTSLETEAQVVGSEEVLGVVAAQGAGLTTKKLEKGVQVVVPPNTQVLEIAYSASDPVAAKQIVDAIATAYLANRTRRFDDVNSARIERVENQITGVVTDLQAAVAASQEGNKADREFQAQLATALRNELVSLRAQETALENSDAPAGSVIAPATTPTAATDFTTLVLPVAGGLAGLLVGALLALVLERVGGVVRSVSEVEAAGLPVAFAVRPPGLRDRLLRRTSGEALDDTVRRVRARILERDPRPQVIAVAPAGDGSSHPDLSEALAESFAKAGHRVVLVRTDGPAHAGGLAVEEGLAQALLHERLNVLDLLKPSVEPLLCLLPSGGFTAQSRELLVVDNVRTVVAPLVEAGNLVVFQSPGIASVEGEAIVGASDLGLVVVTTGRTRPSEVGHVAERIGTAAPPLATLVLGPRDTARGMLLATPADDSLETEGPSRAPDQMTRLRR
jgi:succinoglycan biosynthesis transport protein ExoP